MDNSGHVVNPESTSEACMRCVGDDNGSSVPTIAGIVCGSVEAKLNGALGMAKFCRCGFAIDDECHISLQGPRCPLITQHTPSQKKNT